MRPLTQNEINEVVGGLGAALSTTEIEESDLDGAADRKNPTTSTPKK